MSTGSKAMGKAAGKAKGAAKALAGYPGIFHHLAGEHAEVSAMMKRISSGDGHTRGDLFPELRRNLLAHAHGEEEEFYPRLREFTEIRELVARCEQEHKEVERYLGQLESMDESSDAWSDLFSRMMQAVETHVEREEDDLFPRAKDLLDGDEARQMEERYESVERREKSRL